MMLDIEAVVKWLGAFATIGGVIVGIVKFFQKLSRMDLKLDTIMTE